MKVVLVGAKNDNLGHKVCDLLCNKHPLCNIIAVDKDDFDATNLYEVTKFFDIISSDTDCLSVVSFVGYMNNRPIQNETLDNFYKTFQINAGSLFCIAHALYPIFQKLAGGRLIHIGSNSAIQGFSGMLSYCASKFATHGMIEVIAKEYVKIGAVANQINPCAFEPDSSSMSRLQIQNFMELQNKSKEEILKMMVSRIPMGRLAAVDDLTRLVNFLLFDASDFITGQAFNLSGGMNM